MNSSSPVKTEDVKDAWVHRLGDETWLEVRESCQDLFILISKWEPPHSMERG